MSTDPISWNPPGPGSWASDPTHQTVPFGRFHEATFLPAYRDGFAEGMAAIGSPLETLEAALVNGWMYVRPKPLGARDGAGGPPPKLVFEVLFRVHPALRRRLRTARTVFVARPWEQVLHRWHGIEQPEFRRRLDELAAVDVGALGDDVLARHVERLAGVVADSARTHFAHAPWVALVVGEYFVRCDEAGIAGVEAAHALAGASNPVRRPTELADEIVEALRAAGRLDVIDGPAVGLIDAIRSAGPQPAKALESYLDEVGTSIAGGETIADPTVGEQPQLVQTLLRSRLEAGAVDVSVVAEEAAEALAERVPTPDRAAWRRALADARTIAALRDDDLGPLSESMGRSRLALLEVGRRLVERDAATAPEEAFELRPEEIGPTLAGRGIDAGRLSGWVAERQRQAVLDRPPLLGTPGPPPPLDRFPAPIARVTRAVWAFIARFNAEGDQLTAAGHGVSPGEVTGRAVVIRTLADLDRVEPGDIIVARTTMPTFNTVLAMSAGVVTEVGGAICHAAIMSRELGIPGVVGYAEALSIPDGATIHVDGTAGTVKVLADATAD